MRDWIQTQIYAYWLQWGENKIEEIGYGNKKLVIGAVVKDKVSVEKLIEKINKLDSVQDVDIAPFNEVWNSRNWLFELFILLDLFFLLAINL